MIREHNSLWFDIEEKDFFLHVLSLMKFAIGWPHDKDSCMSS